MLPGWDFWKHVKSDADGNGFTVNLSDVSDVFKTASSDELIVEYQTLIPKTTIRVDNNATLTADEITTPQTDPAFWNNPELKFWVSGDKTVTVQKNGLVTKKLTVKILLFNCMRTAKLWMG